MRWERLSSECLSEFRMDRLLLCLEDEAERRVSEAHIEQCARCQQELAWLQQERETFSRQSTELPEALQKALLATASLTKEDIHTSASLESKDPRLESKISRFGSFWLPWTALAACSFALFLSLSWKQIFPTRYSIYRSGDAPVFLVGLKRGSVIRQMTSGEPVQPGDHIRLAYHWRTKKSAFLYVIHRDQEGKLSALYPSSREKKSLRLDTSQEVALPGSLEFDQAAHGYEEIWACFSTRSLHFEAIVSRLPLTQALIHWEPKPYGPCATLFLFQFQRSKR